MGMLRITIAETLTEQKWTLEGRLVQPWISELKSNWARTETARRERKCVVDLTGVTFIDKSGTSISGGTWLWGWANESLTPRVTTQLAKVRAFGEAENISELTNAELPDDEYLGWEMTAVAAKLLGAKGAYRCPGKNGFVYVVYSSIRFAPSGATSDGQLVECSHHTKGFAT